MTYEHSRRDEHSTLGDAADRFKRDRDAFTAGAQYALDSMVSAADHWPDGITASWVILHAETVLDRVHTGAL
jgi:hypothetical protein